MVVPTSQRSGLVKCWLRRERLAVNVFWSWPRLNIYAVCVEMRTVLYGKKEVRLLEPSLSVRLQKADCEQLLVSTRGAQIVCLHSLVFLWSVPEHV